MQEKPGEQLGAEWLLNANAPLTYPDRDAECTLLDKCFVQMTKLLLFYYNSSAANQNLLAVAVGTFANYFATCLSSLVDLSKGFHVSSYAAVKCFNISVCT